jgi:hypothetical protein
MRSTLTKVFNYTRHIDIKRRLTGACEGKDNKIKNEGV